MLTVYVCVYMFMEGIKALTIQEYDITPSECQVETIAFAVMSRSTAHLR